MVIITFRCNLKLLFRTKYEDISSFPQNLSVYFQQFIFTLICVCLFTIYLMKSHYQIISDRFQKDKVKLLNIIHRRDRIQPEVKHRTDLEVRLSDLEIRLKKLEEKSYKIEENVVEENSEGHDIVEINEVGEESNEEMEGVIVVASKNDDNLKKKR